MEILASSSCLVPPSGGEASELESLELQMHRMEFFVMDGWLSSVQAEVGREERGGEGRDVIWHLFILGLSLGRPISFRGILFLLTLAIISS